LPTSTPAKPDQAAKRLAHEAGQQEAPAREQHLAGQAPCAISSSAWRR
jgi:hypothetical protein